MGNSDPVSSFVLDDRSMLCTRINSHGLDTESGDARKGVDDYMIFPW